jgi:hypothetical protein
VSVLPRKLTHRAAAGRTAEVSLCHQFFVEASGGKTTVAVMPEMILR